MKPDHPFKIWENPRFKLFRGPCIPKTDRVVNFVWWHFVGKGFDEIDQVVHLFGSEVGGGPMFVPRIRLGQNLMEGRGRAVMKVRGRPVNTQ